MEISYVDIHTHHPRLGVLSPSMAGIHPWDAERGLPLPDFAACDIVGETGLDYACKVNRQAQERLFREHLQAAERLRKPVVLHVVRAFEPAMSILADYAIKGVVFHGFIGSEQQANAALRRGYYLSYGSRSLASQRTLRALLATPLDRLFIETDDDPDTELSELYAAVAEIKGTTLVELCRQMMLNYREVIANL